MGLKAMPIRGKEVKRELFAVPNLLSLSRAFILPFILCCLLKQTLSYNLLAIGLMFLAYLTDLLDGYLAKRLNQVTALGHVLDPLMDKVGIDTIIVFLVILRDYPLWAAGVIIARDVLAFLAGMVLIGNKGLVIPSDFLGKLTANLFALSILFYTLNWQFYGKLALFIGMVFLGLSSINYGRSFLYLLNRERFKVGIKRNLKGRHHGCQKEDRGAAETNSGARLAILCAQPTHNFRL